MAAGVASPGTGGQFLIIDLTKSPPELVSADDVIPAAILQVLNQVLASQQTILANQETIMTDMAAEQQTINDMATAVSAVADHVSSASTALQTWIAAHEGTIDTSGLASAVTSLQGADSTLQGIVPQTPAAPLADPVTDPGPVPPPADVSAPADAGAATDTSGSLPS